MVDSTLHSYDWSPVKPAERCPEPSPDLSDAVRVEWLPLAWTLDTAGPMPAAYVAIDAWGNAVQLGGAPMPADIVPGVEADLQRWFA